MDNVFFFLTSKRLQKNSASFGIRTYQHQLSLRSCQVLQVLKSASLTLFRISFNLKRKWWKSDKIWRLHTIPKHGFSFGPTVRRLSVVLWHTLWAITFNIWHSESDMADFSLIRPWEELAALPPTAFRRARFTFRKISTVPARNFFTSSFRTGYTRIIVIRIRKKASTESKYKSHSF